MATTGPIPGPARQVSQDDEGIWMKTDLNTVAETTHVTKDDSLVSEMDNEVEDDVFILPPPPSCTAPSPPVGSSAVAEPSVQLSHGSGSVMEAKANPEGLDRHPGVKQVTTAHTEGTKASGKDQVPVGSEEHMDSMSASNKMDATTSTVQRQGAQEGFNSLTGTDFYPTLDQEENTEDNTGDRQVELESECQGPEAVAETDNNTQLYETEGDIMEGDRCLSQTSSNMGNGNGVEESDYDISQTGRGVKGNVHSSQSRGESEGITLLVGDEDSPQTTDSEDNGTVKSDSPASPDPNMAANVVSETDDKITQNKTCGPTELCRCDNNNLDMTTRQPEEQNSPAEGKSDDEDYSDEEQVDRRPLNYNITKEQWARRDSGSNEAFLPNLHISRSSNSKEACSVATDILQGEQLLQRLQMLQQRQDGMETADEPPPSQQVVSEPTNQAAADLEVERGEFGVDGEDLEVGGREQMSGREELAEGRFDLEEEEEEISQVEKEAREDSGNIAGREEATVSSSTTMPVRPIHVRAIRVDGDNSDDDQSDSGVSADFSPINTVEISSSQNPVRHTQHPPSIAIESEINQSLPRKLDQGRVRMFSDPEYNPDVLEIPFKTSILPKIWPNKTDLGSGSDWQFSEQKMHKEISQEIQRELVMVNQGKIPGGYSKAPIPELRETMMLFEAFQQGSTEGPTRNRRPPFLTVRGHVYPSVLERTRSLELLSLKSQPVCRAQSLRLPKTSEEPRSDSTRLSPYSVQDKHLRHHRSMDSLAVDGLSLTDKPGGKRRGMHKELPAILKDNPFCKLRPALALQPEVVKDIQEAREREEELRRQRCALYGETVQSNVEEEELTGGNSLPGARQQSKGKLDRVWPPPSKTDQIKSGQTQEPRVHKPGGQKASLWQRWEAGTINGQPPTEHN